MNPMTEPTDRERTVSAVAAVIAFTITGGFAFLAVFVLEGLSIWVRAGSIALALLFGWVLFFASTETRIKFMWWFPWL